jgi:hypothetical protein
MSPKARSITGWVLTVLITLLFIFSAFAKLKGGEEVAKGVATMGITMDTIRIIGIVELLCALLFVIPRTGILGTLLIASYGGGIIATHLEHQLPILVPVLLQCVIFITAVIRFPELSERLMGRSKTVLNN